ncbi:BLUF domain-containing protein [Hymenobacter fodinae]|nr:BLUF domain-containing protein [Hymenobacter fodinae]
MSSASLYHLVYHSTATTPFNEADLTAILGQARNWNEAHDLTGILLYSQGDIIQVLEGTQEEIQYIFGRISQDQRHFQVVKLSDGPIRERNFSQWSMGFRVVNAHDFAQLRGYTNPESDTYLATYSENENVSLHSLLSTFITEEEVRF